MNALLNQLQTLGYDCQLWPTLNHGLLLSVTILDNSEARGASLCVTAEATLEQALEIIESKKAQFQSKKQLTK